jgi:Protein of unknown function (DUF4232)
MRLRALVLVVFAVAAAAVAGSGSAAYPNNAACKAKSLTGKFIYVPDSLGAGNELYTLQLRNASKSTCFVSGIPGLRLVGKAGKALPTHAVPLHPGALTAVKVTLKPGGYAAATARFSPDVPGTGEGHPGNCEPVAYKIRISPSGGGSLVGPVSPPTPVCEHGGMTLSTLVAGKRGPLF